MSTGMALGGTDGKEEIKYATSVELRRLLRIQGEEGLRNVHSEVNKINKNKARKTKKWTKHYL